MQVLIATNDLSEKTTEVTLTYDLARIFQSRGHSVVVAVNKVESPMKELFEGNQVVFNLVDFDKETMVNELDLVIVFGNDVYSFLKYSTKTMESCPSVVINADGSRFPNLYEQTLLLQVNAAYKECYNIFHSKQDILHPGPWWRDLQHPCLLNKSKHGREIYKALTLGQECLIKGNAIKWADWLKFEANGYDSAITGLKPNGDPIIKRNCNFFLERYELERQMRQLLALHFSLQI